MPDHLAYSLTRQLTGYWSSWTRDCGATGITSPEFNVQCSVHGAAVQGELRFRLKGRWLQQQAQLSAVRAELTGTVIVTALDDVHEGDEVTGHADISSIDLAVANLPLGWPPPAIELRLSGRKIRTDQRQQIPALDHSGGVLQGTISSPSDVDRAVTIKYSYWDMVKAVISLLPR